MSGIDVLCKHAETGSIYNLTAVLDEQPNYINRFDSKGRTPLHAACLAGQVAVVSMLLTIDDIDVNLQMPKDKRTALHIAVLNKQKKIVRLLAEAGARSDITNIDGLTAYQEGSDASLNSPSQNASLSGLFAPEPPPKIARTPRELPKKARPATNEDSLSEQSSERSQKTASPRVASVDPPRASSTPRAPVDSKEAMIERIMAEREAERRLALEKIAAERAAAEQAAADRAAKQAAKLLAADLAAAKAAASKHAAAEKAAMEKAAAERLAAERAAAKAAAERAAAERAAGEKAAARAAAEKAAMEKAIAERAAAERAASEKAAARAAAEKAAMERAIAEKAAAEKAAHERAIKRAAKAAAEHTAEELAAAKQSVASAERAFQEEVANAEKAKIAEERAFQAYQKSIAVAKQAKESAELYGERAKRERERVQLLVARQKGELSVSPRNPQTRPQSPPPAEHDSGGSKKRY